MTQKMDIIILAAGSINYKFNKIQSHYLTPSLLPLNSKTLGQYLLETYDSFKLGRIFLSISESELSIIKSELREVIHKTNTEIIPINVSNTIIDTLRKSIDYEDISDDVCVSVVTTIPTKSIGNDEVFIENINRENKGWAGFIVKNNQLDFVYKGDKKECKAFQGVFSCKKNIIKEAIENLESKDLIDLIEKMIGNGWNPKLVETKWI